MPRLQTSTWMPPRAPGNTYQDISGTLSVIVEAIMIVLNILPPVVVFKWKRSRERTGTDEFIVAMCLFDILSVAVPTPLGLVSYFNKSWYGGKSTCEFYQITVIWFHLCSMFIVTCLSLERLMTLKNVIKGEVERRSCTPPCVKVTLLCGSLILLFIALLPVMGLAPSAMSTSGLLCESWIVSMPNHVKEHIFYILYLIIGFVNLVIVCASCLTIVRQLCKIKKQAVQTSFQQETQESVNNKLRQKAAMQSSRMVVAVSVLFYFTWFPTLIMISLQKAGKKVSDIAILYALLSTSLTGMLNPLLYGLFDSSYRNGYKYIMTKIKHTCSCCRREFKQLPNLSMDCTVPRTTSDNTDLTQNIENLEQVPAQPKNNVLFQNRGAMNDGYDSVMGDNTTSADMTRISAIPMLDTPDPEDDSNEPNTSQAMVHTKSETQNRCGLQVSQPYYEHYSSNSTILSTDNCSYSSESIATDNSDEEPVSMMKVAESVM
ncbi:hypothetical protein ScPMuIL_015259 [Solemya velum]